MNLTAEDCQYLNENYRERWKKICENSEQGIVIHGFKIPTCYKPTQSDLMLIIPKDYPVAMIDMFYFLPEIKRNDNVAIEALNMEPHFGKTWQRWSRHYQWDSNKNSVISHIEYVKNQLKYELR